MIKIVYVIVDHAYKRVFESFKPRKDCQQFILCKRPVITTNIVPEDYSDFGIKDIFYFDSEKELQKHISSINPDAYVRPEFSTIHSKIILPKKCKKVFVSHGVVAKKMIDVMNEQGLQEKFANDWKDNDLYCGATNDFLLWIKSLGFKNSNILLDALPQIDLVQNKEYFNSYRSKVLKRINKENAEKVLLFFGNRCGEREDYQPYNIDLFDALVELNKICEKNNWVLMVKQKNSIEKTMKFLKNNKYLVSRGYIDRYNKIINNRNIFFITTNSHPYRYFFADSIICSGWGSTIEVDSAAANRPCVVYRPIRKFNTDEDPLKSVKYEAVIKCEDVSTMERDIRLSFDNKILALNQDKYLKEIGISTDGNMHKRITDAILKLF